MTSTDEGFFGPAAVADSYRRYLQPSLFDPWAARLIEYSGLRRGQVLLDVAAGTGAVSIAAASVVGNEGRVIASDISEAMMANIPAGGGARIEKLVCPATALALDDDSVDIVLCQQGLPFMPDRAAVAREFARVLKPGGIAVVAIWAAQKRIDPFDLYAEVMREEFGESQFSRATLGRDLMMSEADVAAALIAGGLVDVTATLERVDVCWPNVEEEALGILGTPFGTEVMALDDLRRNSLMTALAARLAGPDGAAQTHETFSVFGKGTAA